MMCLLMGPVCSSLHRLTVLLLGLWLWQPLSMPAGMLPELGFWALLFFLEFANLPTGLSCMPLPSPFTLLLVRVPLSVFGLIA